MEYLIEDDITKCLTHLSVKDVPDFDIQSKIEELIYSHCKDVCLQCRDLYWSCPRFKALKHQNSLQCTRCAQTSVTLL